MIQEVTQTRLDINLDLFRTFNALLFDKLVTGTGLFLQSWYSEAALVSPAQCSVDQVWRGLDWGLVL